jgi:hypothetical protein
MSPIAPKRKLDVLHLVAVIAGAIAGIAGGQQLAPASEPCPVCPVCPIYAPLEVAPVVTPMPPELVP